MSLLSDNPSPRSARNQLSVPSVYGKLNSIDEKEIYESLTFFNPIARSSVSVRSTMRADFYKFLFDNIRNKAGFGREGVLNSFSVIVQDFSYKKFGDEFAWFVRRTLN